MPWSQEQLVDFLFDGWEEDYGIAAGTVAPVVNHLYDQSEDDVFAIAAYFASRQPLKLTDTAKESAVAGAKALDWGDPAYRPENTPEDPSLRRAMEVYRDQCASCHPVETVLPVCAFPAGSSPVHLSVSGSHARCRTRRGR